MTELIRFIQNWIELTTCAMDKNSIKKLVLFIIFSVCFLLAYGIDMPSLIGHSLNTYEIVSNPEIFKETYAFYYESGLISLFTKYLSNFLIIPLPLLLASLSGKVIIFFIIYKIANTFLHQKENSYFLSVYFVLGGFASHGIVHNGIFGEPFFNRAMFSTILVLYGMYLWLSNKNVAASILLSMSVYFHPLYSVTAIAFLGFGLAGQAYYKFLDPKKLILPSIIIGSNILFAAMISIESNMASEVPRSTFPEWYTYLLASNPDDVFMWYTFMVSGYIMIPLLLLSWRMTRKFGKKESVDSLFMGCLAGLLLILAIELLHSFGMFFGKLSELFIALEFRRGIWVLMFFGLIILFRFFEQRSDSILNRKTHLISFIMFLAAYLSPSIAGVEIPMTAAVVIFFSILSALFMRNLPAVGAAIVLILFFCSTSFFSDATLEWKSVFMKVAAMSFIVIASYFSFNYCFKNYKPQKIGHVFSIVVFLYLGLLLSKGLTEKRFYTSWELISKNGIFSKIDHKLLLSDLSKKILPEDAIQNDHKFIKKLISNNKNHDFILLPPDSLTKMDQTLFKASIFFSQMDYQNGGFSKAIYDMYRTKIELLFGKKEKEKIIKAMSKMSKDEWFLYIGKMYRNIPFENFVNLNLKHGVRYIVTDKRYNGVTPIIIGQKFIAYDMNEWATSPLL